MWQNEIIFKTNLKNDHRWKSIQGEFRGSDYRGVSKNGKQYQVFIMIGKRKRYLGITGNEKDAAVFYDKLAI